MGKVVCRNFRDSVHGTVGISFPEPSLAVQASKDECDINVIIARYMRTGELPGVREMVYADLSEMPDLRDAMHMVNEAQQAFMALPAEVRREFDNDPVKLVEFAQNPANKEKARALGMIPAQPWKPAPEIKEPGKGPGGVIDASPKASQPAKGGSEQPST